MMCTCQKTLVKSVEKKLLLENKLKLACIRMLIHPHTNPGRLTYQGNSIQNALGKDSRANFLAATLLSVMCDESWNCP